MSRHINNHFEPDAPEVDLTELLENLGRRGHGLCGKDADLDYGGQILVKSAGIYEGTKAEYAYAVIRPYAAIIPPEELDDDELDLATEVVCGSSYGGEWDGDYWVFSPGDMTIRMEITDPDLDFNDINDQKKIVASLYDKIFKECSAFQDEMTRLQKQLETLTNMIDGIDPV